MNESIHGRMKCTRCGKLTDALIDNIETAQRENWRCDACEGILYGQDFVAWIEDRISVQTADDATGRFVLRELVQNADDAEAEILVLAFHKDALEVANNGFAFRERDEKKNRPGDFESISRVLAKTKGDDYKTAGNFGSGFQTVYLFTNNPEVHSSEKSFRFHPIGPNGVPTKVSLKGDERKRSPYAESDGNKGALFRLPWRIERDAIQTVQGTRYFENPSIWKRWNVEGRRKLFDEFKEYLHDALICCQHLRKIRLVWSEDASKSGYQAERNFSLEYTSYDGKIGTIKEGSGIGGWDSGDWKYKNDEKQEFQYFITSDFVKNEKEKMCVIFEDERILKMKSYEISTHFDDIKGYYDFLDEKNAKKKSDIHILLPLFPWEKRSKDYRRKCWAYSVIPLPKQTGNNFTFTAHLFPKQSRASLEMALEDVKKQWVEAVLESAMKLYVRSFRRYLKYLEKRTDVDSSVKQKIILDYLPAPHASDWLGLSSDDAAELRDIEVGVFDWVFGSDILLSKNNKGNPKWIPPFTYSDERAGLAAYSDTVDYPRDDEERWLIEKMGYVTFSKEFLEHHRFNELQEFKDRLERIISMSDEKFIAMYNGLPRSKHKDCLDGDGKYIYGSPPFDKEFIDKLIDHSLVVSNNILMRTIAVIPNKAGWLCKPDDLRYIRNRAFVTLNGILPKRLSPDDEFMSKVQERVADLVSPAELIEGMEENEELLARSPDLLRRAYTWLDESKIQFPENVTKAHIVLNHHGNLVSPEDLFWVPEEHFDIILRLMDMAKDDTNLVMKDLLKDFERLIREKLKVSILPYCTLADKHRTIIQGRAKVNQEMQWVIVEGVMNGLVKGLWTEDLVKVLRILPVDGILQLPAHTCLGSIGTREMDIFVGSVDMHIQEMPDKNEVYRAALVRLGMGDLAKSPIGYLVERIDRFANESQGSDGLAVLDDVHHKFVSAILKKLTSIAPTNILAYEGIHGKRILPVYYRKKIVLWTPPRWDFVTKSHRLEQYRPDWPWVNPPDDQMASGVSEFWESVRFLRLHRDYKNVEKDIVTAFEMFSPISDGVPRGLLMHFLVPDEDPPTGIFIGDELDKLVGASLSINDKNRIKKGLLPYIRAYYRDKDHATEQVEPKNKPCLYDIHGVWRKPEDFAIGIEGDVTGFYHTLHEDFSPENKWDIQTLANLGVKDRLEFSKIEQIIKGASSGPRAPDHEKAVLQAVVKSLEMGIGSAEDWIRLSEQNWVPTVEGGWMKPKDSLFYSKDVEMTCGGFKLGSLVDDRTLPNNGPAFWSKFGITDVEKIGLRTRLTPRELIMVWGEFQKSDSRPPDSLFDQIESSLDSVLGELSKESGIRSKLKYFCDGKWRDPKKVVMNDPEDVPEPLRGRFSFSDKHMKLIKWLRMEEGVRSPPQVGIGDALTYLTTSPRKEDFERVWAFVVNDRPLIDDKVKTEFCKVPIFLHESDYFRPSHILVPPRGLKGLDSKGHVGNWLVLSSDHVKGDIDALEALGALRFEDLVNSQAILQEILLSIAEERPKLESALWADFILLFSKMIEKRFILPSGLPVIPILTAGNIEFKSANELLMKDDSGIWQLFINQKELRFFDYESLFSSVGTKSSFESWLGDCGVKNLKEIVRTVEKPDEENAKRDEDLELRFREIVARLRRITDKHFSDSDARVIDEALTLLDRLLIYQIPDISRKYEIALGKSTLVSDRASSEHFLDRQIEVLFISLKTENQFASLEEFVSCDMNPGFHDIYRAPLWEGAVRLAFASSDEEMQMEIGFGRKSPDLKSNLALLDEWWEQHKVGEISSMPTLDGDFWWPALGLDDGGEPTRRKEILRDRLLTDRRLMFSILSMATLLGSNVSRNSIRNFLAFLVSKKLSFQEIYDMNESDACKMLIDETLYPSSGQGVNDSSIHPTLRNRIFDILLLRRAFTDPGIGQSILDMIKAHMQDGQSPEAFLTTGRGYAVKPKIKGFSGMFPGQIYFIVRETTRLGLTDKWQNISFHAPSQVRELIENMGGPQQSETDSGWREILANQMTKEISEYDGLKDWYDIPFFIYYDELCSMCRIGGPPKECKMNCRGRS